MLNQTCYGKLSGYVSEYRSTEAIILEKQVAKSSSLHDSHVPTKAKQLTLLDGRYVVPIAAGPLGAEHGEQRVN